MKRLPMLAAARSESQAGGAYFAYIWAMLAGLLLPVLIVMAGLLAELLNSSGLSRSFVRLGTHLNVPLPRSLVSQAPLLQLTGLVAVSFVVATVFCFAVWMNRVLADNRARRITKALHQRLLRQSLKRAEIEGAAAQQIRADELIGRQLPELQRGLSLWYRSIPRSILMLLGCVAVALMVNVWLALLAVICGVLLLLLYQKVRNDEQLELSDWQVPRTRSRMVEIVGQAPVLARLQTQGLADRSFDAELDSLYRRLQYEDARAGRVWPILLLASAAAIGMLILGLGVNLGGFVTDVSIDKGLSLPAALVLGLSLTGAVVSAARLSRLMRLLRISGKACDGIYAYLKPSDETVPSEQRVGFVGLRRSVEVQDATLTDSNGDAILSHVSLELLPRSFVAFLGTDFVSTRAFAELLMGFGRPTEGRVLIDEIPLFDVHPSALAKNVMWIDQDGPVWDGTIIENLRGGDDSINNSDMVEALEKVDVYERLQRLPEGLNSYVTAGDSMLGVETTYALGVARGLLHRPPIVLVSEPPPPTEHLPDDPCLTSLRDLAAAGSLVVMLPRRLQTLRNADRVVLFNGPRLVGEGKHQDLLNDSDLYRHLNYLLFNPYRHSKANRKAGKADKAG